MEDSKNKLLDKIKASNAILITVSNDPTVDQLAACIAFALLVNKLNKTGSALYSGQTPSTIEFLKPEETLEKNTDSLQDFIISLDKNKADKLRTKVDDQSVKIFITPYKTSLSENDLEFSQGDFNVDLIIALGVYSKEELDSAIINHGGILHDATIATITINDPSDLGSINLNEPNVSSFCELIASLSKNLGNNLVDQQIATALLTGIVAETDRFSNDKTNPQTMSISSDLMNSGANPKLIASELGSSLGTSTGNSNINLSNSSADGDETLNIDHDLDQLLGENDEDDNKNSESPELAGDQESLSEVDAVSDQSTPQTDIEQNPDEPSLNKFSDQVNRSESLDKALEQESDSQNPNLNVADSPKEDKLPPFVPPAQEQGAQPINPLDSYDSNSSSAPGATPLDQGLSNTDQASPGAQTQTYTPPPSDWQAPEVPPHNEPYPAILTNHHEQDGAIENSDSLVQDARSSVEDALGSEDELPSGAPPSPPVTSIVQPDLNNPEPKEGEPQKDELPIENPGGNQTGLDPSLFSEPEKQIYDNSKAPPVPPPVVQLPFNNNDQSNPNR